MNDLWDSKVWSGGEVHITLREAWPGLVRMTDYSMNGFMELAQYVEICRRNEELLPHVIYPYLPYARQDRAMSDDTPFSLQTFCKMLNALELPTVEIWDPHSDVAPALIDNVFVRPQDELVRQCIPPEWFDNNDTFFVAPDAGAYKKLQRLMPDTSRIVTGMKVRATGVSVKVTIHAPCGVKDRACLIVDDICDGGRTFIALARALRDAGASEVHLYVTHGIFSYGLAGLKEDINHIYTTDSWGENDHEGMVHVERIT